MHRQIKEALNEGHNSGKAVADSNGVAKADREGLQVVKRVLIVVADFSQSNP